MNTITVILIVIVLWLVYALLQSYRRLEKELREIRVKCVGAGGTISTDTGAVDPVNQMQGKVVSMLQMFKASI